MKSLVFICSLVLSFSAFAKNPKIFEGKYEVTYNDKCDRDPGTRAYVSVKKTLQNKPYLLINYYSDESVMLDIPLQSGVTTTPGHSANDSIKDHIKVSWKSPLELSVEIKTKSDRFPTFTSTKLVKAKQKAGKTIALEVRDGDDSRQTVCDLKRVK